MRQPLPNTAPAPEPQTATAEPVPTPACPEDTIESNLDLETSLLKALVEAMLGYRIKLMKIPPTTSTPAIDEATTAEPLAASSPVADDGLLLRVEATQTTETEVTEVAFSGQVSSADGLQISMNLQYLLQRSYSATTFSASIASAKPTDPLVLNFDGLGVALDAGGTQFDLDGDELIDTLPTLRTGSSYLALDRNGDGTINNGLELFGPQSGDGYSELAQFDVDGNNFIDDADPVFGQLQLFRPGEISQALISANIGAIFLGNVASPARLTDDNNQSLGQLRATGFYLTNSGTAGLVQQVDLVA